MVWFYLLKPTYLSLIKEIGHDIYHPKSINHEVTTCKLQYYIDASSSHFYAASCWLDRKKEKESTNQREKKVKKVGGKQKKL